MEALAWILRILFLLVCVVIIALVLMQDSKGEGLSAAITGGTRSTFISKNKGRTKEGLLSRLTVVFSVLFIVLAIVLGLPALQ
ncbi:MAG: preprotein translocase subunit SecG [Lachnospiraceae bacterium]|nr:preprotein translocase subunit SecG [Lachnospiraceae bacterium]MBR5368702.1 preprotein translocase subunit SecG [Lachnospiraceae bacterium]